jgi:FAD/FMN-containing dehydrogenase
MSKIAQYLNEHILGEVITSESARNRFSKDGSILSIKPELIVNPKVTNDIRKIARFTWQLAEKGHAMPITVRGGGSDQTGAAIGSGIIINTSAHLDKVLYISLKNKDQFVHVQPGTNFSNLNRALLSNDMAIPATPSSANYSTIGGAVANNASGKIYGKYGIIGDFISRFEVVLANGDLIETSRITRRELSKKKGLQSFEGEIYRKLDALIEDNQKLIKEKITNNKDNVGYSGISRVKAKDGSFDLTPLLTGSQGTLGIISEIVLKTEFIYDNQSIIVASFKDTRVAHDAADAMMALNPSIVEIIDNSLFLSASETGKKYPFVHNTSDAVNESILYLSFDGQNERAVNKVVKKALKKLSKLDTAIFTSANYAIEELESVREVSAVVLNSVTKETSVPPILNNASIDSLRREEFIAALKELGDKHHIDLPTQINWLNGIITVYPKLNLHSVGDKQKTFKIIGDYVDLVAKFDGSMSAQSGEGRLKATAIYSRLDPEILDLYKQIRTIFNPHDTLNPGVKQESDLKTLISQLNPDYAISDLSTRSINY